MISQQIFDILNETYFGKIARDNTVDDTIFILGQDREFFRKPGLDYSNPDFRIIRDAITKYKESIRDGNDRI